MTSDVCVNNRRMLTNPFVVFALIVALILLVTLPGWVAAGIWGMHVFIKTICIFWPVLALLVLLGVVWYHMDPHAR